MNNEMVKVASQYAEVAENLLIEQGLRYTDDDVVKVANFLIDQDYPDEYEKTAYLGKVVSGAKAVGNKIHGGAETIGFHLSRALMNKKLPQWVQDAGFEMGQNMHRAGYGAAATAAAAMGAGYGLKKAVDAYEKTAEEELADIRTAAFYDELEKSAYLGKVVSGAKAVGNKIHGGAETIGFHLSRALMNKKLPQWVQDAGFEMGQNMHRAGYGAAATAAAAMGAGYGIKKALD